MAKGNVAKTNVFQTLLETFPNSFMYNDNKELRINLTEEGVPVQIKVTLTAAKTPVEPSEGDIFESNTIKAASVKEMDWSDTPKQIVEPTEEEKQRVDQLIKSLGL